MSLKIACQMDPIDRIDIRGDSTFALLLEAQRRGHELFYYTPPDLALDGSRLIARGASLRVEDRAGDHYRLSDARLVDLAEWDVVLLRQDPPFDMAYITTTHLLERITEDARRQRSGLGQERTGKGLGAGIPGPDAAHPRHPQSRGREKLPRAL